MNLVNATDESVWKVKYMEGAGALLSSAYDTYVYNTESPPLLTKKTTPNFTQSSLDSLDADEKVWAFFTGNVLNIYISAKSKIKPEIFDMTVWQETPVEGHKLYNKAIWTNTDHKTVWVYWLKKGVSVFDLTSHIGHSVRNRAGFVVQPPQSKWVAPTSGYTYEPLVLDTACLDESTYMDEIPF